ncbi:MAG: acyl-CoA dehydrogenase family protein [Micromonosporaceae bacterium]|nr:acyl-CoA dehydrogenase family protein [Micromonosporaceae bacterium]
MMLDWTLLAPDEDSRDLARTARALFRTLPGAGAARAALDDGVARAALDKDAPAGDGTPVAPPAWFALVDAGYLDIAVPEDLGGLGRMIDLVVVLEEAGRSLLTAPLLPAVLAVQTQVAAGIHRPEARSAPAGFAVASGTVADGRCFADRVPVLGGVGAATLTAILRAPDRAWVVTLDAAADGVEVRQTEALIDPSRPVAVVRLAGAPSQDSQALTPADVEPVLARARVCAAADLVGIAAGALEAAVAHAVQRQQFGALIGSFQAVKHQLADAYLGVERARSLTYGAAVAVDHTGRAGGATTDGAPQLSTRDSLLAYAAAAEVAVQVAGRFIQVLGAMGVTFEADGHLYLRRAHQMTSLFGAPDDHFLAAARLERATARMKKEARTVREATR